MVYNEFQPHTDLSCGPREKGILRESHIYVADDHPLIIEAFKLCFNSRPYVVEVSGFSSINHLDIALALPTSPDLVLIDFNMPGLASVDAVARFIERHPEVRIAIFSGEINAQLALDLIQCGSLGFVPKSLPPTALYHALQLMIGGHRYIPPFWADGRQRVDPPARPTISDKRRFELTAREEEILAGLAKGMSNKQIANALGICEVTVKLHLRHSYKKLGVCNRVQALNAILKG